VIVVPGATRRRAAAPPPPCCSELEANLLAFVVTVARSRHTAEPADVHRAGRRGAARRERGGGARPAGALVRGDGRLPAAAAGDGRGPRELQGFYEETVAKLAAYDEQYETELVRTLETFLDADGNVAKTSEKLFTHRHTIRYRLERVKELTDLDVASTDGRERLSWA
jgi:DNA-binding PucR family transcriptional regulator